jgi:hypothetical protein
MARESQIQGLQIALIVFVLFTLALGVSTFLVYGSYKDALVKAKTNLDQANEMQKNATALQDEANELKRMIGVAPTVKLDGVQQQFSTDMKTYASSIAQDKQYYRPAIEALSSELKARNGDLVTAKAAIEEWKTKYEGREATKDAQIKTQQQAVTQASDDLQKQTDEYKQSRERLTKDEKDIADQLAQSRKDSEVAVTTIKTQIDDTIKEKNKIAARLKEVKTQVNALTRDNPDVADGEIRWVDQRNNTVWIDRGRADGLQRQATFSVYAGETTDLAKTGKKGSIEVSSVLGDHLAQARITDDKLNDPILPGDKIFTPVWRPGEHRHFAMAGRMEVDNDGRDQRKLVRDLITSNGGVIDAEIDEKGNKVLGELTPSTRYLVLGTPPDAKSSKEGLAAYSKLIGDADKLNIEKISVAELLNRMGWRSPAKVVSYGVGGNAGRLPAEASGPQHVSGGSDAYSGAAPSGTSGGSGGGSNRGAYFRFP